MGMDHARSSRGGTRRQNNGARRTKLTAYALVGLIAGMGALVAAAEPMYRAFCQVTGFGGTTRIADQLKPAAPVDIAAAGYVTVRFDANTNANLPWRFRPVQNELRVRVGEQVLAHFEATNLSGRPIAGTATFNVTPYKTARYFNKIECFCFTEQVLGPGETAQMPVTFFVDREILKDAGAKGESTITLSYTFFADKDQSAAREAEAEQRAGNHGLAHSDAKRYPASPGKLKI